MGRKYSQFFKDLSDIKQQRLSWLGKDKNKVSSFTEVLGMLYDTFGFEDYMEYYKTTYGKKDIYFKLVELNDMINDYQKVGYVHEIQKGGAEKILND